MPQAPPVEGDVPTLPGRQDDVAGGDRDEATEGRGTDERALPPPGTGPRASLADPLGRGLNWPPGQLVTPQIQTAWQVRQQAADAVMDQLSPGAIHLRDVNEQAAGTASWRGFLDSMVWGSVLPESRTWCRELFRTHGAQTDLIDVLNNFWDSQDLPGIAPGSEGI